MGPCYHGIARPQVVDAGKASNMEYTWLRIDRISSREQPTIGGPPDY